MLGFWPTLSNSQCRCLLTAALLLCGGSRLNAVIALESGDPQYHASSPGDNSGWQYEGLFHWFLAVPISPNHFITAKHIGGTVGMAMNLHGDSYVTIGFTDHPSVDLRIWEVDHSKPFPTYAPLSSGISDIGATASIFGRGTLRGDLWTVDGVPIGWKWGASSTVKRWGRNQVDGELTDPAHGKLLYADFNNPGIPGECHLSIGDSGGGLFVMENGLWRLAGVNYAVDGPFRETLGGTSFNAALYDAGNLYIEDPPGTWSQITDTPDDKPSAFYCTRISAYRNWILAQTGESGDLAAEDFASWLHWYFTPAQLADSSVSGPEADWDGDGLSTLMEFALNLDPSFNERAQMTPGIGTRGLPHVSVVSGSGGDRLAMEFVRRTTAGGGDVNYVPQFSSNLVDWDDAGTEGVTSINSRWDRVVFTDAVADPSSRFTRLKIVKTP